MTGKFRVAFVLTCKSVRWQSRIWTPLIAWFARWFASGVECPLPLILATSCIHQDSALIYRLIFIRMVMPRFCWLGQRMTQFWARPFKRPWMWADLLKTRVRQTMWSMSSSKNATKTKTWKGCGKHWRTLMWNPMRSARSSKGVGMKPSGSLMRILNGNRI